MLKKGPVAAKFMEISHTVQLCDHCWQQQEICFCFFKGERGVKVFKLANKLQQMERFLCVWRTVDHSNKTPGAHSLDGFIFCYSWIIVGKLLVHVTGLKVQLLTASAPTLVIHEHTQSGHQGGQSMCAVHLNGAVELTWSSTPPKPRRWLATSGGPRFNHTLRSTSMGRDRRSHTSHNFSQQRLFWGNKSGQTT